MTTLREVIDTLSEEKLPTITDLLEYFRGENTPEREGQSITRTINVQGQPIITFVGKFSGSGDESFFQFKVLWSFGNALAPVSQLMTDAAEYMNYVNKYCTGHMRGYLKIPGGTYKGHCIIQEHSGTASDIAVMSVNRNSLTSSPHSDTAPPLEHALAWLSILLHIVEDARNTETWSTKYLNAINKMNHSVLKKKNLLGGYPTSAAIHHFLQRFESNIEAQINALHVILGSHMVALPTAPEFRGTENCIFSNRLSLVHKELPSDSNWLWFDRNNAIILGRKTLSKFYGYFLFSNHQNYDIPWLHLYRNGWKLYRSTMPYCVALRGNERVIDGKELPEALVNYHQHAGLIFTCSECSSLSYKSLVRGTCLTCLKISPEEIEVKPYSTNVLHVLGKNKSQKEKPRTPFPMFRQNSLQYGCELEYNVANTSDAARVHFLVALPKFVIFKSDGSLERNGFEMVTLPATLEEHKELFKTAFNDFPSEINVGDQRAGMHVHASRKALTQLTLARCVDFMHNKENLEFLSKIAQRPLGHYCHQDPTRSFGFILLNSDGGNRHVSLNTCRTDTIEFRIFLTPHTYPMYIKNLEFCDRLIHMMQAGWTEYSPKQSRHYSAYLDWVKKQNRSNKMERNSSPYLYNFLKEIGAYS